MNPGEMPPMNPEEKEKKRRLVAMPDGTMRVVEGVVDEIEKKKEAMDV